MGRSAQTQRTQVMTPGSDGILGEATPRRRILREVQNWAYRIQLERRLAVVLLMRGTGPMSGSEPRYNWSSRSGA